jgi:hypothetical protein
MYAGKGFCMTITQLINTFYVFKKEQKQLAILKRSEDGTLKIISCSIEMNELTEFLWSNGYSIS